MDKISSSAPRAAQPTIAAAHALVGPSCHGCPAEHLAPQLWELSVPSPWRSGAILYDFLGRIEGFNEDFEQLLQILRLKNGNRTQYEAVELGMLNARQGSADSDAAIFNDDVHQLYKQDSACLGLS